MAEQLWLLRHGEAVPHDAPGPDDARALTERGRREARDAGRALAALGLTFQLALTSPKVRARDTAQLACAELGIEAAEHAPLRQGFGLEDAQPLLHAAEHDQRLLLVGHEPDLSQLVHDLTGARIDLKKGGVAGIRLRRAAAGELITLLRPRELALIAR